MKNELLLRMPRPSASVSFYFGWLTKALGALALLYLITAIYLTGHSAIAFACLTLFLLTAYVYGSRGNTSYKYVWPGLVGVGVFVVFPLLYTVNLGFTNYSSNNLLDYERARQFLLDETVTSSDSQFAFTLHELNDGHILKIVSEEGEVFVSPPISLGRHGDEVQLQPIDTDITAPALPVSGIIKLRKSLKSLNVRLPSGDNLSMEGLRRFALKQPLYESAEGGALRNLQTGETIQPNWETGFFETPDHQPLAPGFRVNIGFDNYIKVFGNAEFQKPFFRVFTWTVIFAGLTVLFTLIVGVVLAVLLSWEDLKYRTTYRTLLFLPYAVPGFISILVFKGLFNENFGEINMVLDALFGISPGWFSDPFLAKVMLLIVNTWLGYPYIMILCTGLLKAIPKDLYEASAIEGAGVVRNFFKITLPLIIKPLSPLLVSSFAFNFNNFVLIALLTAGRPDFLDSQAPAGTTDLLVTYTYRIAFEDSGQNFGLAAAISTVIFLMVALISFLNLRLAGVNSASESHAGKS